MTDIRERLLTANPWKLMIILSLPAILGQFVVGFYAFIDSIFVGQMVGTAAMSAVSAASPGFTASHFNEGKCFRGMLGAAAQRCDYFNHCSHYAPS